MYQASDFTVPCLCGQRHRDFLSPLPPPPSSSLLWSTWLCLYQAPGFTVVSLLKCFFVLSSWSWKGFIGGITFIGCPERARLCFLAWAEKQSWKTFAIGESDKSRFSLASSPGLPCFYLPFAFTIIHRSRRQAKNGEGLGTFITWVDARWT